MLIPQEVMIICDTIRNNGFEAYLVGGCVRDWLLNKEPNDWDIATSAKPDRIQKLFKKTIPSGIIYGTITVVIGDFQCEVTSFRGDSNYSDGRRPDEVIFVENIEEDLKRRDFTINSLAFQPEHNKNDIKIIDLFGGQEDLNNKIIKAVGDPNERLREDALRMLRACRFASQLGFSIEEKTLKAIKDNHELLKNVSQERIYIELKKILLSEKPSIGLRYAFKTGLMNVIFEDNVDDWHEFMFEAIDLLPKDFCLRSAILFNVKEHIIKQVDLLKRLKYSAKEIKKIHHLTKNYNKYREYLPMFDDYEIRMIMVNIGKEYFNDVFEILLANENASLSYFSRKCKEVSISAYSIKDLAINGDDLQKELKLSPGPEIKKLLDYLFQKVTENPEFNNKEKLLELAKYEKNTSKA